ncbi:MAG: hypothetical protein Q4B75_10125 [Eubacteriales bacterium]|nr:hypothetical protein [Eubacteriales bacterium]
MKKFRGINGTLILKDDSVLVLREKGIDGTFHDVSEIEIPYSTIEDVEIVPGGLINGYICIVNSGINSPSNIFKAMKNDNTVIFRIFKNDQAIKFAEELKSRI